MSSIVEVVDWGRVNYREAFARQNELVERVLANREEGVSGGGFLVLVAKKAAGMGRYAPLIMPLNSLILE